MSARSASAVWLALALGASTGPALAGSAISRGSGTVHVILGDPTSTPPLPAMRIIVQPNPVASGEVTFAVANTSTTMEHELLVVRVPGDQQRLPYDEISRKVLENRIDKIGDSGDLKTSTSTTFALRLKPGRYLLMCNEPGHYRAGMWAWLTVGMSPPATSARAPG